MQIEDVCAPYAHRPHRQWKAVSSKPEAWTTREEVKSDPRRWLATSRTKVQGTSPRADRVESLFKDLTEKWKDETINLSDVGQIILNDSYQRIVGLGPTVLPYIFGALSIELDWWFPALRAITGVDPIADEDVGDMEAMRQAWLRWAELNGYL